MINGNKSENRIFYGRIRTSHIFDGQTLAPGALLNTVNQSHDSVVCGIHKNKYKQSNVLNGFCVTAYKQFLLCNKPNADGSDSDDALEPRGLKFE